MSIVEKIFWSCLIGVLAAVAAYFMTAGDSQTQLTRAAELGACGFMGGYRVMSIFGGIYSPPDKDKSPPPTSATSNSR